MNYDLKIKTVCEYIQLNLDGDLNIDQLCAISHLSKYHFHRIFSVYTGIALNRFVSLSKLKKASYQLAFKSDLKVIDIAFDANFESHEAFSRAFKKTFDQTPSAFRKHPHWQNWHKKFNYVLPKRILNMQVNTIYRDSEHIAYLSHFGAPNNLLKTAAVFIEWRKQSGLSPVQSSHTYGIAHADPNTVPEDAFRFDFAGSVNTAVIQPTHNIQNGIIPAGRYAVIRHCGSHEGLGDCIYYLYREWLSKNHEEVGEYPVFFHYHNFIHDVNESELVTDVLMLLKDQVTDA